jgi:hypothetical protein
MAGEERCCQDAGHPHPVEELSMWGPSGPVPGQTISVITVAQGHVHAVEAEVERLGDADATLRYRPGESLPLTDARGALVTLHYLRDDGTWRVRGRATLVSTTRVQVKIEESPSRGERREHIRAWLPMRVRLSGARYAEALPKVRTVELAGGGIRFRFEQELEVGSRVKMVLASTQRTPDGPFDLDARVLRCGPGPQSGFEVAFQFIEPNPEIIDILLDLIAAQYFAEFHLRALAEEPAEG